MANYVFNIAKKLMASGDIRLDDPGVDLSTGANGADTSHSNTATATGEYRVLLIGTGNTLFRAEEENEVGGTTKLAIDLADLTEVEDLKELNGLAGYTDLASGGSETDGVLEGLSVESIVAASGTSYTKWDATDTVFNNIATGGAVHGLLIIWSKLTPTSAGTPGEQPGNASSQIPLVWIDLSGSPISTNGGDIEIVWASDGILRLNA